MSVLSTLGRRFIVVTAWQKNLLSLILRKVRQGITWRRAVVGAFLVAFGVLLRFYYDSDSSHKHHLPLYKETKKSIQSASAVGVELNIREWIVDTPRGIIFIVHGFGEYIDRYSQLAANLNEHSYNVYGLDHQGHGLSGGDRVHVNDFMDYTTDILSFVDYIHKKLHISEKQLPHFLLGHSMGGAIALQTAVAKPDLWKGIIVSAPALERVPMPLLYVAQIVSLFNPKLPLVGFTLDKSGLNSDPEKVQAYLDDDLVYKGNMKVGWGRSIIAGIQSLYSNVADFPDIPTLFLHGIDDTITKLSDSQNFYNLLPQSMDKQFIKYPETRHELFQETNKEEIIGDVCDWLDEHNKS